MQAHAQHAAALALHAAGARQQPQRAHVVLQQQGPLGVHLQRLHVPEHAGEADGIAAQRRAVQDARARGRLAQHLPAHVRQDLRHGGAFVLRRQAVQSLVIAAQVRAPGAAGRGASSWRSCLLLSPRHILFGASVLRSAARRRQHGPSAAGRRAGLHRRQARNADHDQFTV